jgi:hypothetical protein
MVRTYAPSDCYPAQMHRIARSWIRKRAEAHGARTDADCVVSPADEREEGG